jgi:broad specificity phosphatase PhoE
MEILLIRHARPFRLEVEEGSADPSLDDLGRHQAEALASWLAEPLSAVYTSPLRRAVETAAPLARRTGLVPQVVDDIAEWDRDSPAYIPIEELKATGHPWWEAMADNRLHELGIDVAAFAGRVVTALDAIAARHPSERVAVVCHGGVINVFAATVLAAPNPLFFEPAYASISRVLVSRDGVRSIRSLNETGHLRDP